jgi:hypothetical protein
MPVIQDPQIQALILVAVGRLNANVRLREDLRDTLGLAQPVGIGLNFDPGPGMLPGMNVSYPALCMWRIADEFYPETMSRRAIMATVGIKIVLPASNNTPLSSAILHRYASVLDEAFDDSWEDQWGGDVLKAANLIHWELRWSARYGYEGPDAQVLYPTMTGTGKALHDRGFDPNYLPDGSSLLDVVGISLDMNLRGVGQDGDEAPAFNPLVGVVLPSFAPINPYAPPAAKT